MKHKNSVKLGQNFLINFGVAGRIIDEFFPVNETVLEIGPGKGVLTDILINKLKIEHNKHKIIIVEIDKDLANKFKYRDLKLINKSILEVIPEDFDNERLQIISNVPYYISKEVINWIIDNREYIFSGILMFQKEFADKILKYNERKYKNPQGIIFNHIFKTKKIMTVSPGSFNPPPKVYSTIIKFNKYKTAEIDTDTGKYHDFLRICFKNKRKTLYNNLIKEYKTDIKKVFNENNINQDVRASELNSKLFTVLYRQILLSEDNYS